MNNSELVKIGKLVQVSLNNINKATDRKEHLETGEVLFKTLAPFNKDMLSLKDYYLILDKDKIRFFVPESYALSGTKIFFKISDIDLIDEIKRAASVFLAIANETYEEIVGTDISIIGYDILFDGEIIAKVTDVFYNNAHDVIVAETHTGETILLPDVEEYVVSKNLIEKTVTFINIQDFLDINH